MARRCSILLTLALVVPLCAQQPRLQLDAPALAARAGKVDSLALTGNVLRTGIELLAKQHELTPKARAVLAHLQGVYIKRFQFAQAPPLEDPGLDPIRTQLHGDGWARVGKVKSPAGQGAGSDEIYICTRGGTILGMAVIHREPHELDLVNVVGSLQLTDLIALGGHLGVPALGKLAGGH